MASSTPFDGTNWLTTAPDQDQPHGNDYQEHQSTRKSIEFVNNKEHEAIANDPSAADGGGEHKVGSAKIYHGDYSTSAAGDNLPTLRPDGATALDASDAGRRAYDTDATYGGLYYRWSGSAWVSDGKAVLTTDNDLSGNTWFLNENDLGTNSPTKTASQRSIKTYVDAIKYYGGAYDFAGDTNLDTSYEELLTFTDTFSNKRVAWALSGGYNIQSSGAEITIRVRNDESYSETFILSASIGSGTTYKNNQSYGFGDNLAVSETTSGSVVWVIEAKQSAGSNLVAIGNSSFIYQECDR
jgi:hypothetical protein